MLETKGLAVGYGRRVVVKDVTFRLRPGEIVTLIGPIGGGGSGIPVYRNLQRQGIPFAAGVIHENDLDFPVAQALAAEVIAERSFTPVGEDAFARARAQIAACSRVLCPLKSFGPMNEKNLLLRDLAQAAGKLKSICVMERERFPR